MSLESLGIDLRDVYPSELSMGYNHNLRVVLSVRIVGFGDKDGDKPRANIILHQRILCRILWLIRIQWNNYLILGRSY